MTDKLTDEQLREWAALAYPDQWKLRTVATELLALRAERAKLEAALRKYETYFCEGWCEENEGTFDDCSGCIAKAALAQPAESGATDRHDKIDEWDFEHAKRRVIEQTEHGFVARDRGAKP